MFVLFRPKVQIMRSFQNRGGLLSALTLCKLQDLALIGSFPEKLGTIPHYIPVPWYHQ